MEDLKKTIQEIKLFRIKDFNPSDDTILNCATKIFMQEREKFFGNTKNNSEHKSKTKFEIKDPNSPATDAQKDKLKKLGVNVRSGVSITKGEASQLIDERINVPYNKTQGGEEEFPDY
jgi:hypothetical protein